ncbi:MAG TPA: DUF4105 domain-containing protein, partial [Desulfuromonadales bacterium]|nr:DUF4105 domain-containing protein [Desulfuromonadales bacterium]
MADRKTLHESRYWHILLHYKPTFQGVESLIDDPDFFLAPQGKTRPREELHATLAAFFDKRSEDNPRCRFVARYDWLAKELGIDESRLPAVSCEEFETTRAKVEPRSAALVFPSTHNNSPASMFGHTLISIRGPYESRLLAWAINYSAFTRTTNGLTYAIKGIFGLYPGYYSVLPYAEKLRTYADMERRDVWEYELNLSPEEVRRLFLHTWELREIHSDYYFFDENCAYNLLFLLEAARPSLNLTDQCRPWVIPIDTVRIVKDAGLTQQAVYRPSKATRIAHIASHMDREEERLT